MLSWTLKRLSAIQDVLINIHIHNLSEVANEIYRLFGLCF